MSADPRDEQTERWNAALASGDETEIAAAGGAIQEGVRRRQLDDWDVHARTGSGGAR